MENPDDPFTVAAGLRKGMSVDEPVRIPDKVDFLGETFKFGDDPCGGAEQRTLRDAFAKDAKGPFIDLAGQLGADAIRGAAHAAGIPGIAVGRYPLRPGDMANAYATFAADGMRATPHLVSKVRDGHGEVVWERPSSTVPAFDDDEASSRRIRNYRK